MVVGGWFDAEDLFGALHTYEAIEKQNPVNHRHHAVLRSWGRSSVGRALEWHSRGRRFDPDRLHHPSL